jgi:hypothetical protein
MCTARDTNNTCVPQNEATAHCGACAIPGALNTLFLVKDSKVVLLPSGASFLGPISRPSRYLAIGGPTGPAARPAWLHIL